MNQGICKDCGNGTLNNTINPAFDIEECEGDGLVYVTCNNCGSNHVEVL